MLACGELPVGWTVIVVVMLYRSGSLASSVGLAAGAGAVLAFALIVLEFEFAFVEPLISPRMQPDEKSPVSPIIAAAATRLYRLRFIA